MCSAVQVQGSSFQDGPLASDGSTDRCSARLISQPSCSILDDAACFYSASSVPAHGLAADTVLVHGYRGCGERGDEVPDFEAAGFVRQGRCALRDEAVVTASV